MSVEEQLAALAAIAGAGDVNGLGPASQQPAVGEQSCDADPALSSSPEEAGMCDGTAAASVPTEAEDQVSGEAGAVPAKGSGAAAQDSRREVVEGGTGSGYMPQFRERFFTADGSSCAAGSGMLVSILPIAGHPSAWVPSKQTACNSLPILQRLQCPTHTPTAIITKTSSVECTMCNDAGRVIGGLGSAGAGAAKCDRWAFPAAVPADSAAGAAEHVGHRRADLPAGAQCCR